MPHSRARQVTLVLCLASAVALAASTAVTIRLPQPGAGDTTLRGGSFAAVNFDTDWLVTRASSDPQYVRRALLDFDLTTAVPAASTIDSASLTLTVHLGGADASRLIGVFDVARPFVPSQATWDVADASTPWTTPGGDLGREWTRANVPNTALATVTFDVTALVQAASNAAAPRHARLALVDVDALSNARDGYREYYGSESSHPERRPVLNVSYSSGTSSSTLPAFARVFIIVMENKEASQIIGSPSAPYINSLAGQFGLATSYTGVTHPSLPNYMALTGGETVFTTDCVGCTTPARHVVDQIVDSGRTWKAYMDSMSTACSTTDTSLYVQKHNPWVHYDDVVKDTTRCRNHVVPYTQFATDLSAGTLPSFVWITPDLCHDMHDCSIQAGDTWLSKNVPPILASPQFNDAVLFLVWDEGTTAAGGGGQVAALVVSPFTPAGTRSARAMNHYNVLRTIEDAWKLPPLGHAAGATAMAEFFKP
jgi:phosphatidylinositol-3-phosphatase